MSSIYLQHHGIKGMKWGIRRYQNADGTLTEEGKKKYYTPTSGLDAQKEIQKKALKKTAVAAGAYAGTGLYFKYAMKDIPLSTFKKSAAFMIGVAYVSNVLADEITYATTGSIKKW